MLALWRSLAPADGLADSRLLGEPIAAGPNLMVVIPVAGGDWRYAIVGARLAEQTGDHWRTELVSELGNPDRAFVSRCFALTSSGASRPTPFIRRPTRIMCCSGSA